MEQIQDRLTELEKSCHGIQTTIRLIDDDAGDDVARSSNNTTAKDKT